MPDFGLIDGLILLVTLAALLVLFNRRVLQSKRWRATITPLASIIGSGFFVLAPILTRDFGNAAPLAMAGLCLASYLIGSAVRWNIRAQDKSGGLLPLKRSEAVLDRIASASLSFAYVISVCYYLNLLGAFLVRLTPLDDTLYARLATSVVLVFIGVLGWTRGLRGLERSEEFSVGVKLAIIAGLLAGMTIHVADLAGDDALIRGTVEPGWHAIRIAFGLLITVQGFEISRYLGKEYDAGTRIATMRHAQWISAAIYMAFIGLASVSFAAGDVGTSETAVIGMMGNVATILPFLLVVAALASQFSAAVADTNGSGGLAEDVTKGRITSQVAYAVVVAASLALTWTANVFQIISYASRAFAGYYALQCALATTLALRAKKPVRATAFALLTTGALAILFLGIPAE